MSERWAPKYGEIYWVVDTKCNRAVEQVKWVGCNYGYNRYCNGNYFKTEAEAQSAAEKVKALLLSLHDSVTDCNQLPKLTTEVFNRPDCPVWARYAVVNSKGTLIFFGNKPNFVGEDYGCWSCDDYQYTHIKRIVFDASDWKNSLIERPAVLPDWCKVGEWCYCGIGKNNYTKIKKVLDQSILAGEYDTFTADFINSGNVLPARLRPYNAEEMKALVGKAIEDKIGNRCLITCFTVVDNKIVVFNKYCSADDLLKTGYTINGSPCGKLEHLENGEWVE